MHVGSSLFTFLDFKYLAWLFAMKEWVVWLLTLYKSSSMNSSKVEMFVLSDVLSVLFHWLLDTSSSMPISANLFLRKVCRTWKPGQFSQRYTIHSNCSVLHAIIFIKSLYVKINFSVYVTVSVGLWTSSSFFFSLPFKYLLMILNLARDGLASLGMWETNDFLFLWRELVPPEQLTMTHKRIQRPSCVTNSQEPRSSAGSSPYSSLMDNFSFTRNN